MIVIVTRVPGGSFFFLNGLSRLSFDFAVAFLKVLLLYGQPFFCCFFFLVLQLHLRPGRWPECR